MTMTSTYTLIRTLDELAGVQGEFRAGGTDFMERLVSGISTGPVVDISKLVGLNTIDWSDDGAATIGALVPIATLGRDADIQAHYPALALPANSLATPQIREMGTMGGVLLQRNRCWYYRHPDFSCFRKGGNTCPAREGNDFFGVCFDLGPCVYPHPSSIGMALLAYEAQVEIHGHGLRSVADLYGDGSDPLRDNQLKEGELLTHIQMPVPEPGEQAAYFRLMSRRAAEWPLVEVITRLVVEDGTIQFARVSIGAVANIPLRLSNVEKALEGQPASQVTLEQAARKATEKANPLPITAYKVHMVYGSVLETLTQAMSSKQ